MKMHYRDDRGNDLVPDLEGFTFEDLGGGKFRMSRAGEHFVAAVSREGPRRYVSIEGVGTATLDRVDGSRRRSVEHAEGELHAPMPGRAVKVFVAVGDSVTKGEELVILEAMKMEIKIVAPLAGRVKAVHITAGDPCDAGQRLIEIES